MASGKDCQVLWNSKVNPQPQMMTGVMMVIGDEYKIASTSSPPSKMLKSSWMVD